jgi:hypothetical protein
MDKKIKNRCFVNSKEKLSIITKHIKSDKSYRINEKGEVLKITTY